MQRRQTVGHRTSGRPRKTQGREDAGPWEAARGGPEVPGGSDPGEEGWAVRAGTWPWQTRDLQTGSPEHPERSRHGGVRGTKEDQVRTRKRSHEPRHGGSPREAEEGTGRATAGRGLEGGSRPVWKEDLGGRAGTWVGGGRAGVPGASGHCAQHVRARRRLVAGAGSGAL